MAPTSWVTAISVPSRGDRRLLRRRGAHRLGRALHGLDDVHVARTPAEVAFEALPDLVLGRVRVLVQEVGGRHDETRRAVAALQAVLVPERLLDRVQLAVFGHALDRGQALALGLDRKHGAALDGFAVDQDRARAALARVAADTASGEPELVAQVVHEQESRLDLSLVLAAVDGGRDLVLHPVLLPESGGGGGAAPPVEPPRPEKKPPTLLRFCGQRHLTSLFVAARRDTLGC